MSQLMSLAPITLAAVGLFTATAIAQDEPKTPNDTSSRVKRCLDNLLQAKSYAFRCSTESSGQAVGPVAMIRQLGQQQGGKQPADVTEGVRSGQTVVWTRDNGETVLANRGRTWITKDRDGNWIPGRRPLGNWKNQYLPDPEFLASGLQHLMKRVEWESAGPSELNEKPVRVYKLTLENEDAQYLMRTQTLPKSASLALGGAVAQFVVVAAGGGGAQKINFPEPKTKIEVRIYEDPAKRMPMKITADLWIEDQGGGLAGGLWVQGGVVQGGKKGAQKVEEEEEEEADGKRKKPTLTVTFDLEKVGTATADVLDDAANAVLGK